MRVAIADDHALFRQGLKSLLRLQPDVTVVAEVERADALLSTLEKTPCDVLLLDLQMERSAFVDIEVLAERVAIETLMTAIHTVVEGHVWLPPALQAEMAARLREPIGVSLTRREREIVR